MNCGWLMFTGSEKTKILTTLRIHEIGLGNLNPLICTKHINSLNERFIPVTVQAPSVFLVTQELSVQHHSAQSGFDNSYTILFFNLVTFYLIWCLAYPKGHQIPAMCPADFEVRKPKEARNRRPSGHE